MLKVYIAEVSIKNMRKITEQECIEELHRIIGIHPKQIVTSDKTESNSNLPLMIEDLKIENLDEDFDGILLDYEDLKATLFGRDLIINTTINADSLQFALEQVKKTVNELESKNLALSISDGVLVYFTTNSNTEVIKFIDIMEVIYTSTDRIAVLDNIHVLFGTIVDNNLKNGYFNIDIFVSYKNKTFNWSNF